MANRAKQATLVLNLSAIAVLGLLYRLNSADDHNPDQQTYPEETASELTNPKDETTPPLHDVGIKMIGINLPAPPPVEVARVISAEFTPAKSDSPALKQNVATQTELQSKPALTPMKVSVVSPRSNLALKKSLAKPATPAPSPKTLLKPELMPVALRNVMAKTPVLQPLSSKKTPSQAAISSDSHTFEVASPRALVKARKGYQRLSSSRSVKEPSITPLMPKPVRTAPPSEIRIQQANLLRGQQALNKVVGEGGLDMEIFWPPTAKQSEYLYKVMTQCFGMQSAVIDSAGDLFFTNGKGRGSRTGFSPLLRKIMQPASRDEVTVINEIVKRNAIGDIYTPVRIFSKSVDARLVDGVAQMTGKAIHPQSILRANYVIDQGRVYIANVTHDGILSSSRLLLANGRC